MTWANGTRTQDVTLSVPLLHPGLEYTVPEAFKATSLTLFSRMFWKEGAGRPWLLFLQGEYGANSARSSPPRQHPSLPPQAALASPVAAPSLRG